MLSKLSEVPELDGEGDVPTLDGEGDVATLDGEGDVATLDGEGDVATLFVTDFACLLICCLPAAVITDIVMESKFDISDGTVKVAV